MTDQVVDQSQVVSNQVVPDQIEPDQVVQKQSQVVQQAVQQFEKQRDALLRTLESRKSDACYRIGDLLGFHFATPEMAKEVTNMVQRFCITERFTYSHLCCGGTGHTIKI